MADTLVREVIAYASQPLSPVPQYWDGASYVKVQGVNGAIRIINYNSAGETFTGASPGSVQLTATSTINYSGTGTIEILSSAGGTAYFSGTNPGSIQLTATSTVNFSGSGTVAITGSVTVTGSLTADIAVMPVIGIQANAWSANATVTAGATSNAIDCQYTYNLSIFGTVDTTSVITVQISQDDTTYYNHSATITMTAVGTFHRLFDNAARYTKLSIDTTATITATIAGK